MNLFLADSLNISIQLLFAVLVIVSLLLLGVVLMQRPKQEGLGAAFGAAITDQAFGARTTDVLKKATVYFGTAFMVLCLGLGMLINRQHVKSSESLLSPEEIKMIDDQPDELAMENCSRLVFKGDLLEHDVAGDPEALAGQTGAKLKEYIKREYTCDSIVVAVAGNFNHDEVIELVEKRLTSFERKKDKVIDSLVPYQPGRITICKDIEQTNLCIGTRFVTLGSDEYFAAAFFNNILGGSMSSRLFQNIREEKGLAYTIVSMPQIMARSGMLMVYAGIAHNKISECLDAVHHELDLIGTQGISKEELQKAKNQGKSSVVFSMERTQSRMMSIGRNLLLLDRVYEQEEVLALMTGVTIEEVNQLAHQVTKDMPFSYAAVTPKTLNFEKLIGSQV